MSAHYAMVWGLPSETPIGVGVLDAHAGAVGAGVSDGALVKILGTSTCDLTVLSSKSDSVPTIQGISGLVPHSILPDHIGVEAGQSAVGDLFNWGVKKLFGGDESLHLKLTELAHHQKPGESGLLALDWNNGNRCTLADSQLTGLMLGQTLQTNQADIYRALIEATAFGSKMILDQLRGGGIEVNKIICSGGIADKNPMLMQIYADITECDLVVSETPQSCAFGSALLAAHGAKARDNMPLSELMAATIPETHRVYQPISENVRVYGELYSIYKKLVKSFSKDQGQADLSQAMKDLLAIRLKQRSTSSNLK